MSEQKGTLTRIRMKEEGKAMEEGANRVNHANAKKTKGNLVNTTSTTSKTMQTREAKCQ